MEMSKAKITIAVTIEENGSMETKIFAAEGATEGDVYELADGILTAVDTETSRWIQREGQLRRSTFGLS